MDRYQTAPTWIYSVCQIGFKIFRWTTIAYNLFVIYKYRGNKCEFIENWGHDFHEMHARLRGINTIKKNLIFEQMKKPNHAKILIIKLPPIL